MTTNKQNEPKVRLSKDEVKRKQIARRIERKNKQIRIRFESW